MEKLVHKSNGMLVSDNPFYIGRKVRYVADNPNAVAEIVEGPYKVDESTVWFQGIENSRWMKRPVFGDKNNFVFLD